MCNTTAFPNTTAPQLLLLDQQSVQAVIWFAVVVAFIYLFLINSGQKQVEAKTF